MSSREMNRRAVLAGTVALAPAAALAATSVPLVSPELIRLIDAHRAAFAASIGACHQTDYDIVDAAFDAENDALGALCKYRCRTLDEARAKGAYLVTVPDLAERVDVIEALLGGASS